MPNNTIITDFILLGGEVCIGYSGAEPGYLHIRLVYGGNVASSPDIPVTGLANDLQVIGAIEAAITQVRGELNV